MSVKLVVLKSGENLITDIKEGFDKDKLITYILENPCSIRVNGKYTITDSEGELKDHMSVSLHPWPDFSADTIVPIVTSYLVTAVEPTEQLKKMYEEEVLNGSNKNTNFNQQPNSDKSD